MDESCFRKYLGKMLVVFVDENRNLAGKLNDVNRHFLRIGNETVYYSEISSVLRADFEKERYPWIYVRNINEDSAYQEWLKSK